MNNSNEFIKNCPLCDIPTFKDGGCDYIKCSEGEGRGNYKNCNQEWCWRCLKPKYNIIISNPQLGCCNDKSHNSH